MAILTNLINKLFLLHFLLCFISITHAESSAMTKTQTKLKELENKITKLQKTLTHAHDKHTILNQELASTEKKIGEGVKQLLKIQQNLKNKQSTIKQLQHEMDQLSQELHAQQTLLANHIRIRYKIGEYQPLKWLLNQKDPYAISRLLTFYQYVMQSHQRIIEQVTTIKNDLSFRQNQLNRETTKQQKLHQQLTMSQRKLQQEKRYQSTLIHSLNQDIRTTEETLKEYQRNQANLTRLFKSLEKQRILPPKKPFSKMRHKLPRPVKTNRKTLKKINQGVLFFAQEGEPVTAIYPGKVVFSDWLRGYGLLLIIDHGQDFMSLYAHNQSLFKQTGDTVHLGEQIATVGHSGGLKQNGLYFEVRHRGKAISPPEWLS